MTRKTIISTYDDTINEYTRNTDAVNDIKHEISLIKDAYIPMKTNLELKIKLNPDNILDNAFLRIHYYFEYKLTQLKNRLNDNTRGLLDIDAIILIDKDTTRKKKVIQDNLFKAIHELNNPMLKPLQQYIIQGPPKKYNDMFKELESYLFEIRCCQNPSIRSLYKFLFEHYHPILLEIKNTATELGRVPKHDYWMRLCERIKLLIDTIQKLYQFQEYNV